MVDGDSDDFEFLWPEPDVPLFVSDAPDWQHDALLPTQPDWLLYRLAYRRALEVLIAHVLDRNVDQDFLIYPILFTGRHTIELGVKHVIRLEQRMLGEDISTPATHDLLALWEQLRELLERDETVDVDDLNAVQGALESLSDIDAGSFSFRYPTGRDGEPSFDVESGPMPGRVNIRELSDWFKRVLNYLDGCTEYLYALRDAGEF